MRNLIILILASSILTPGCGDLLAGGSSDSNKQQHTNRVFKQAAVNARLSIGRALLASPSDEDGLVEMPMSPTMYNRVTCEIGGQRWTQCYSTSEECGGGAFPTACFNMDGGMRACVRGSGALVPDPLGMGASCVGTTLDGAGLNGAPIELVYCGAPLPPGRAMGASVTCD